MRKLIHFGCSFAVGNSVPEYTPGLKSGAYIHLATKQTTVNCGKVLAEKFNFEYDLMAENGASNEMIFRKLQHADIGDSLVLIGITSDNRREALTTKRRNTHWHTWKMVPPQSARRYKDIVFDPWGDEFTPAIEEEGQIRTVLQILYMQSYLKLHKTPYLFYNSLHNNLQKPLTNECETLLTKVDQKHFYKLQGSFNETQHGWCLQKNLIVSEHDEHPNVLGQKAWADLLEPMVEKILNAD